MVWLKADPAVLAERVDIRDHRPCSSDDPAAARSSASTHEREPLYRAVADIVVDEQRGRARLLGVDQVTAAVAQPAARPRRRP